MAKNLENDELDIHELREKINDPNTSAREREMCEFMLRQKLIS